MSSERTGWVCAVKTCHYFNGFGQSTCDRCQHSQVLTAPMSDLMRIDHASLQQLFKIANPQTVGLSAGI